MQAPALAWWTALSSAYGLGSCTRLHLQPARLRPVMSLMSCGSRSSQRIPLSGRYSLACSRRQIEDSKGVAAGAADR
jgi:hypothetical protein